MAKYSKEQRRCAVELYVRYECCAADVIRELGYPSREALRMWHRDWLEEQRTGVPSSREVNWLLVGFRVHGRHHEITSQKTRPSSPRCPSRCPSTDCRTGPRAGDAPRTRRASQST